MANVPPIEFEIELPEPRWFTTYPFGGQPIEEPPPHHWEEIHREEAAAHSAAFGPLGDLGLKRARAKMALRRAYPHCRACGGKVAWQVRHTVTPSTVTAVVALVCEEVCK